MIAGLSHSPRVCELIGWPLGWLWLSLGRGPLVLLTGHTLSCFRQKTAVDGSFRCSLGNSSFMYYPDCTQ